MIEYENAGSSSISGQKYREVSIYVFAWFKLHYNLQNCLSTFRNITKSSAARSFAVLVPTEEFPHPAVTPKPPTAAKINSLILPSGIRIIAREKDSGVRFLHYLRAMNLHLIAFIDR